MINITCKFIKNSTFKNTENEILNSYLYYPLRMITKLIS